MSDHPSQQVAASVPAPRPVFTSAALTFLAATLLTAIVLSAAVLTLTRETARVEVDLEVSAGAVVALFVNDLARPPQVLPVEAGGRHRYVFDGIVDDIRMLRLDPTDASGATIRLHGITVSSRDAILARFDPPALSGWTLSGLAIEAVDSATANLTSTTTDPILTTSVSIPLGRQRPGWTAWVPMVNGSDFVWRLAGLGVFFLIAVASFVDPARRLHAVVLVAAAVLVGGVLATQKFLPDAPGSAAMAVSRATVVGASTRPALLASAAMIAGALLIGGAAAFASGREGAIAEPERHPLRWSHAALAVLAIVVLNAPDLDGWATNLAGRRYVPNWDGDNLVYWSFLLQEGRWPLRDFWYPYGGAAVFEAPFPLGPVFRWFYLSALFALLFLVLARWRGTAVAAAGTAIVFLGFSTGVLPAVDRYLLAPLVVLAYVTGHISERPARGLFWSAWSLALFIEPPQLVYAAVPIAIVLALHAFRRRRASVAGFAAWLSARLRRDFGPPAILALVTLLLLWLTGQLGGALEMYARLGDAVAYSTWPSGLPSLETQPFPRLLVLLIGTTAVVGLGAFEVVRGGSRGVYGEALLGLGLVIFMVLQKHFMRWMDDQLLLFAALLGITIAAGWPGSRRRADYVAWGLVAGTFVAMLAVRPSAAAAAEVLVRAPLRAVRAPLFLISEGEASRRSRAARFAPERFEMYHLERRAAGIINRDRGQRDAAVFALTDEMAIYVLAGQRSTWIANMYDTSPIYRQERVVEWLRREAPPYAVFNLDHLVFDQFQMLVRVPLVYAEVVASYVPIDSESKMQVLRRRTPDVPIALSYWRDRLGADVFIGRLASVSSYGAEPCEAACGDLLEVRVPAGGSGPVTVPLTAGGLTFSVTFTRVPSETTYRLLLDRVWFWNVAKRAALPHEVATTPGAEVSARVKPVGISSGALY